MDRKLFNFNPEDISAVEDIDLSDYSIDVKNLHNVSLGLGITDNCNLNCPICYYRENNHKRKGINISLEQLTVTLSELRGIGHIVIGLEGEPLCHPKLEDVLKICSQYTKSISLVTNGLLISHNLIQIFNDNKVENIIFSCDGTDKETYEENRIGGSFLRFCNKLEITKNLFKGNITLHAVIHNKNYRNLLNLPAFASNFDIHCISFAQLRLNEWNAKTQLSRPSITEFKSILPSLVRQAELFNVTITFDALFAYGELLKWMKDNFSENKFVNITAMERCLFPWGFTSILSNGQQFLCCGDFVPCNVNKYDFDSLYNNDYLRTLRYLLVNNKLPKVCQSCLSGGFKK